MKCPVPHPPPMESASNISRRTIRRRTNAIKSRPSGLGLQRLFGVRIDLHLETLNEIFDEVIGRMTENSSRRIDLNDSSFPHDCHPVRQ